MVTDIPTSMRAIALAAYGKPSQYDIATLPTPQVTKEDEVLIRVHAAAINPIDVKLAAGEAKIMIKDKYVRTAVSLYPPHFHAIKIWDFGPKFPPD